MRRSGRSRKQREFFRPPEAIQELDSAEESEDDAMAPPKGKPSIVRANKIQPVTRVGPRMSLDSLATGATAARKKGVAKDAIFTYEGPRSKLFDAMLSGGTGLASEVRAIVSMFERNHISAISELINFVLLAGGARKKWIGNRVELDGLEPQEMEELLRDMVAAMTAAEGAVIAPLAALPSKKGVSIRDVYFDVWSQFVDSVNSPLSQGFKVGYTEGSNPAVEILEMLIGVLISLSSNGLASIRDAVTEAALDIGQCVLGISVAHRGKRDIAARQIKAEDQKNKSSKLTPKYKTLQKQVAECDEVRFMYVTVFQ